MSDPAEQHAKDHRLSTVMLTTFEALRVACGEGMICRTSDGREVLVRLYTVDEVLEANARGREYVQSLGVTMPAPISRDRAADLVKPLDFPFDPYRQC